MTAFQAQQLYGSDPFQDPEIVKPLISQGFQPPCFPHLVDNFHQCPKRNNTFGPFFQDFPAQGCRMFRQVQVICIPAAAEILYGIGYPISLVGIPQSQDAVVRKEARGDHPGNMVRPHPVQPVVVDLGRNEAGDVVYVHGVFFRADDWIVHRMLLH